MLRCYFYGLSEIYDVNLYEKVLEKLDDIVQWDDEIEFLFYSEHQFILLCLRAATEIKKKYPQKITTLIKIELVEPLVEPNDLKKDVLAAFTSFNKEACISDSDVTYPGMAERNLMKQSDYVLAYYYPNLPTVEIQQVLYAERHSEVIPLFLEETVRYIEESKNNLDARELHVLTQLAAGKTAKELSDEMGISASRISAIRTRAVRNLERNLLIRARRTPNYQNEETLIRRKMKVPYQLLSLADEIVEQPPEKQQALSALFYQMLELFRN